MRILINGYHWGGNTPPFVAKFKELGHEVKLVSPLYLSKQHLFKRNKLHECLTKEDIVIPEYSLIEKFIIKAFRKLRINFIWIFLVSKKIKRIIKNFKPDIIYNHTFSKSTHIMIKTGFRPQTSFPFGTDVMGPDAWKDFGMHQEIIKGSEYIISSMPAAREFFIEMLRVPHEKLTYPIHIGLPGLMELINNNYNEREIREKFNIPENKIVLLETRGLRWFNGGSLTLIKAFQKINREDLFLVMTKGFLGQNKVIDTSRDLINQSGLNSRIKIIEDEVAYKDLIGLYKVADINLSLLPHDGGIAKSIMEAISQRCLLILTDLPDYKMALDDNAEYVRHENIQDVVEAINTTVELTDEIKTKRIENNLDWLIKNQNFDDNCKELIALFEQVINENSLSPVNK